MNYSVVKYTGFNITSSVGKRYTRFAGIRFPPEVWRDVAAEARRKGLSASDIVRSAVEEYLRKRGVKVEK